MRVPTIGTSIGSALNSRLAFFARLSIFSTKEGKGKTVAFLATICTQKSENARADYWHLNRLFFLNSRHAIFISRAYIMFQRQSCNLVQHVHKKACRLFGIPVCMDT
jgi:hypothetical protein